MATAKYFRELSMFFVDGKTCIIDGTLPVCRSETTPERM
jgi:hypothetical protein